MEWKNAIKKDDNSLQIPERWLLLHYYEALNLLFRIENALRVFVYIILKNELKEGWSDVCIEDDDNNQASISSIAKKRMAQSQSFGYLGHPVLCPIMHLTSGELTRLIISNAYWKYFNDKFLGGKEIIKQKLEEIGSIRNSLAHFRPMKQDDVDVIKQNSKHVLGGIERYLSQALHQSDVVPTNTAESWYKDMKTLGTEQCTLYFYQSADEKWARIIMRYSCPIINTRHYWRRHITYDVLTIKSSSILTKYQTLRRDITYLSEYIPYVEFDEKSGPNFCKHIAMVFSRKMLNNNYGEIMADLKGILQTITEETDLIKQDNLARGNLVHSVSAHASADEKEGKLNWRVDSESLETQVIHSDPTEYWGELGYFVAGDFIAGTNRYPWMPEKISEYEFPF